MYHALPNIASSEFLVFAALNPDLLVVFLFLKEVEIESRIHVQPLNLEG